MIQNGTWELNDLLKGKNKIRCKWVFKRKLKVSSNIDRYKVRLMAKGYSQVHELDYYETFFPIMKIAWVRILLALTRNKNYGIQQMDVKTEDQFFEWVYLERTMHAVVKRIYQNWSSTHNLQYEKGFYMDFNIHMGHGMKDLISILKLVVSFDAIQIWQLTFGSRTLQISYLVICSWQSTSV